MSILSSGDARARLVALVLSAFAASATAADKTSSKANDKSAAKPAEKIAAPEEAPAAEGEELEVEAIKQKYWAAGDSNEMGVVQNRLYSKAGKFQAGVFGGYSFADPFLSVMPYGFNLGYHFNEYFGLQGLYTKYSVSDSSALTTLKESGKKANTVLPKSFYGGEAMASFLYGKLSLIGWRIIYYDMYFSAGAGMTDTENGNAFTLTGGIGQRFYINRYLSFRFDYRLSRYNEEVIEKEIEATKGEVVGTRANMAHTMTLGLDLLL